MTGLKAEEKVATFLLFVFEATNQMIIDHANGLHECVANGWTYKVKAAALQVFAHGDRFLGFGGNILEAAPSIPDRRSAYELPDIPIEAREFLLNHKKCLRVAHSRFDLEPVAHDAGIFHEAFDLLPRVARNLRRVEGAEGFSVSLAFSEDRRPAQSRLGAFKDQELEQHTVIMLRNAPLVVVISNHGRSCGPAARLVGHMTSIRGRERRSLTGQTSSNLTATIDGSH